MENTPGTIHDERLDETQQGVVLVVRRGNKYGKAKSGERVRVDAAELRNTSTMSACMPEDEYEKLLAARDARMHEAPALPKLKAMVEDAMAQAEAAAQAKRRAAEQRKALEDEEKARKERDAMAPPSVEPTLPKRPRKLKKSEIVPTETDGDGDEE